jgi:hypothetical protein
VATSREHLLWYYVRLAHLESNWRLPLRLVRGGPQSRSACIRRGCHERGQGHRHRQLAGGIIVDPLTSSIDPRIEQETAQNCQVKQ